MTQTSLFGPGGKLEPRKQPRSTRPPGVRAKKLTLLDKVKAVLSTDKWLASWQVQQAVAERFGTFASDSSITARLRELRQVGVQVESRRVKGKSFSEYRLG